MPRLVKLPAASDRRVISGAFIVSGTSIQRQMNVCKLHKKTNQKKTKKHWAGIQKHDSYARSTSMRQGTHPLIIITIE